VGGFVSGDPKYSFEIIERICELRGLGCPILVGTSRKGFLGDDRFGMTLWTTTVLRGKVDYLRVHDTVENVTCVGG
jgi:dihydropteroate synthase